MNLHHGVREIILSSTGPVAPSQNPLPQADAGRTSCVSADPRVGTALPTLRGHSIMKNKRKLISGTHMNRSG